MPATIDSKIKRAESTAKTYDAIARREYAYYLNGAPYDTSETDRQGHYLKSQSAYQRRDAALAAAKKLRAQKGDAAE